MTSVKTNYHGHFFLPAGRLGPGTYERFGYGGRAMCLYDGRLIVSGHPNDDFVAEVKPAEPGETAETGPFMSLADRNTIYDLRLNTLVGVVETDEGQVSLWQEFYDVDGSDVNRKSLCVNREFIQLGTGSLKQHAGYMTYHDESLWVGRSDGAGNVSIQHGPSLHKVRSDYSLETFPIPERADWTAEDRYTGLVFLPEHVCWLVSKAVGSVWYGTPAGPNGEKDVWDHDKGYHTDMREVWLLPYTWPELVPQDPILLPEFHESARCGGIAYDKDLKRLYIHERWPPVADGKYYPNERPRIHMYDIGEGEASPEVGVRVKIEIEGDVYEGVLSRVREGDD